MVARPLVAWLVQELYVHKNICSICFDFARFLRVSALLFSRIVYDSPFRAFRAFCVTPPAHALARAN